MKKIIKNTPFIGKKLVGLYSWYLRTKDKKFLIKNLELKNKFAGRKVFVIATGPSINKQDLKKLAGQISISVSNFFLHPDFNTIKPTYHLFAPIHPPVTPEQFDDWMKDAETHFPEGQNVLVSITDKYLVDKFGVLKKQNVYYYSIGGKPLTTDSAVDFSRRLPIIQTSPQIAVYLALFIGAKEIYLVGVDHDWILHFGKTRHFYDEKQSTLSKDGYNEWQNQDFGNECEAYGRLWEVYRQIRAYVAVRNMTVFNSTAGGLLDVFPIINLDKALEPVYKKNE